MVYIDNAGIERHGQRWSHLVADSLDELHNFAALLAVPRRWFHAAAKYPHYDITAPVRHKALLVGARPGTRRQVIACAKALRAEADKAAQDQTHRQVGLFD